MKNTRKVVNFLGSCRRITNFIENKKELQHAQFLFFQNGSLVAASVRI